MPVNQIDSDSIVPIDQHFRVSAGPGAGKTHWLVNHIQHVLQSSHRLGNYKRVACITYTNIAVDTILKRMHFIADRVEVSTIHGFVYKNILKPYISFIASEYEVNVMRLDGHDDHYVSHKRIKEWLNSHENARNFAHPYSLNQLTKLDKNIEAIGRWLSSLHYVFESGQLKIAADNGQAYYLEDEERRNLGRTTCLDKLFPGLMEYKKMFWRKGVLHHDDVLFFGYIILSRYPFIVSVLRSKFPYFFIDEFQDTSPIQAEILNLIGQQQTIVGIIGDKAQSIFSFQGASPEYFERFSLPFLKDYLISDNRRSTDQIINILNHIRKDIRQRAIRQIEGNRPVLFIGKMEWAFDEATRLSRNESVTTLSWDNITSNAMKRRLNSALPNIDLIAELSVKDTNSDRKRIIISCINAVELARQKRFKEAIKEMERNFRAIQSKSELRKIAFRHLVFLLSKYDSYKTSKLHDFYELVKIHLRQDMVKLTRGGAFDFFQSHTYEQVAVCIKIVEDNSPNRTIHKSKGDEFNNVLLILEDQKHLNFLINPNLSTELHRLFYVGVSRARDLLFINVPYLHSDKEASLNSIFEIIRMPTA